MEIKIKKLIINLKLKQLVLKQKFNVKYNSMKTPLLVNFTDKLVIKLTLTAITKNAQRLKFYNGGVKSLKPTPTWHHCKYYFTGLGYKVYVYDNKLFVWVGLTHYTLLKLPSTVLVFAKKKRIYIVGSNMRIFNNFLMSIRGIKRKDIYKGKGLLEVKNYKNFTKMKTGKKKQ